MGPTVDSSQLLTPDDCGHLNEPKLNKMFDYISFSVTLTTSPVPHSHVRRVALDSVGVDCLPEPRTPSGAALVPRSQGLQPLLQRTWELPGSSEL